MKTIKKIVHYLWLIIKTLLAIFLSAIVLAIFGYYLDHKNHDGYVKTADGKAVENVKVRIYCGVNDLIAAATEEFTTTDSSGYYTFHLPSSECKSGYNDRNIVNGQKLHTISTKEVTFYQRDFVVKSFSQADLNKIEEEKKAKAKAIEVENSRIKKINDKFAEEIEQYMKSTIDADSWYKINYADLNEDRLNEALIYMVGTSYCPKSGSCSMKIMAKESGNLLKVAWHDNVIKDRDFYIDTGFYSSRAKYKRIVTDHKPKQYIKMRFEGKLTLSQNKRNILKDREELSLRVQKYVESTVATKIELNRGYTLTFLGVEPNITIVVHLTHKSHNGRKFSFKDTKKDGLINDANFLNYGTNRTYVIKDIDSSFGFSKIVTPVYFKEDKESISRYETYYRDDLTQKYKIYPNEDEFDEIEKELKNIDNLIVL